MLTPEHLPPSPEPSSSARRSQEINKQQNRDRLSWLFWCMLLGKLSSWLLWWCMLFCTVIKGGPAIRSNCFSSGTQGIVIQNAYNLDSLIYDSLWIISSWNTRLKCSPFSICTPVRMTRKVYAVMEPPQNYRRRCIVKPSKSRSIIRTSHWWRHALDFTILSQE